MKRLRTTTPSAYVARLLVAMSAAFAACPGVAAAATQLPPGCPPATALVQRYPLVHMPDVVGQSVSTSKVAASLLESSERLVPVTTTDLRQQGTVAKQCPAAGRVVNENPKTGVPGVSLWIYQYGLAPSAITAHPIITDSPDGLTPLWLLTPGGGPYWLRITYNIPL